MADAPRARITADSFRALTARLRKTPPVEIRAIPVAEAPEPEPPPAEVAALEEAEPAMPEPAAPEPEPLAAAPEPEPELQPDAEPETEPDSETVPEPLPQAASGVGAIVLSHFEPLQESPPLQPEPEPEPSKAPLPEIHASEPVAAEEVPAVADSEPLPEAVDEEAQAADPADPADAKAARGASPLAGKVFDALVRTISDAVYARPTPAERAAFLREVAELVEKGEVDALALVAEGATSGDAEALPPPPAAEKAADPFTLPAATRPRVVAPPPETAEADEDTGELALSLLDMMSGGSASSQPQERALAADTLLRLVPRIPVRQLLAIAERLAIMESPPSLLVARLIRDARPEIAAPLLERCMHISDHDLTLAATEGDVHKQRMTARRRVLSPSLSDQLIARGDTSVILTLVRNPGAALNHEAYYRLMDIAIQHHALLAPLTTRADLPAPVAFELFWHVPQELRRFIFSRFLTDSENLNKILRITLATQAGGGDGAASAETKFPPREAVDAAIATCMEGQLESAAGQLAAIGGIAEETALRILADRDGEPLAVVLKGLGYPRARFAEALAQMQSASVTMLRPDRNRDELQGIFDTLSFNKARILLTYWDWFTRQAGPYAPHH